MTLNISKKRQRKLRKLFRNPRLFYSDMMLNRFTRKPSPKHRLIKTFTFRKYSVVSAVYNVEDYLEDFFVSLENQVLDFKSSIFLIMVDDGSTDGSAEVILRWKKKYPNNIKYVYKENGGQTSARNVGLKEVETEWVTFIDPDDFVDKHYFSEVDRFLNIHEGHDIGLLCSNLIFYHEDRDEFKNSHALRFRFAKGSQLVEAENMGKNIQLSAASAFFKQAIIQENDLEFDERIRPTFEDAHFVGRYLWYAAHTEVAFVDTARYYYRKRVNGTSLQDTVWGKPSKYSEVLEHGFLDLIQWYINKSKTVPVFIQRTVLYDLTWYFKQLIDRPERTDFLSQEQRVNFMKIVDVLFGYIDPDVIRDFELAGCWYFHKVGFFNAFKQMEAPFEIAYIERFDNSKRQVLIHCITGKPPVEQILVGEEEVTPAYSKIVEHKFLERSFCYEKWIWVPLPEAGSSSKPLTVTLDGKHVRLTHEGKQHFDGVTVEAIENAFRSKGAKSVSGNFNECWLLMDSLTKADDNAEHLYRYILREHPETPAYFVLRDDSRDWPRLKAAGFRLIAYGSDAHRDAMMGCSKIISSDAVKEILDPFDDGRSRERQFVFLQHGITINDLSLWLNNKARIDLFVTSSAQEYTSIVDDGSKYRYSEKETRLLGLPRHDSLLSQQSEKPRVLLVMPTWRRYLVGQNISASKRQVNSEFRHSDYTRSWKSLLSDPRLTKLSEEHGLKIVFFPHVNVRPYLDEFDLPDFIEVQSHSDQSMQELFGQCAVLLTDYSSVTFETAYLGRPSIYYQFDEAEFYAGEHVYQKGYFDYQRDGFGPVHADKDGVISSLEELLARDCAPLPEYKERMDSVFAFRDGKCCERVFEAIHDLDRPNPPDFVSPLTSA